MNFSRYRKEVDTVLSEISSNVEKFMKSFLDMFGITVIQFKILSVISEKGNIPIGELSNRTIMDAGNMSSMCKKLEKNGYLVRTRNLKDERVVEVSLTDKAKDMITKLDSLFDERFKNFFENENDEDLEVILRVLKKLSERFTQMNESLNKKIKEK